MRRGRLWSLVTASALGAALALVPGGVARANTFYPSGCQRVIPNPWANGCTQGQYFVDYGTSVLGVQYVLFFAGWNPGTPDCDFGPNTDGATIRFQQSRGLTADGEVGPNTWTQLQTRISHSGASDMYGAYYNNGSDGLRFYYQIISNSWFVLDPYATPVGYRAMNALGTSGGLCP